MDHDEIIRRLAAMPDRVAQLVVGVDEETLSRRPAEGEWSMKEVCGHLVEDARTWQERFVLIASQTGPYLERLDPDVSVREGGYQDAPIENTVDEFRRIRRQTVELLAGLLPEGWERVGRHWSEGRMTIAEACSVALDHAEMHLEQLQTLKI
jgi:DinB superfamily